MELGVAFSAEELGPNEVVRYAAVAEEAGFTNIVSSFPCGPDPERHIAAIANYRDAGYDEIDVTQVGPRQEEFPRFYEREVLPAFSRPVAQSRAS